MIKNLCILFSVFILVGLQSYAEAHRGHHHHRPHPYPSYPYPQPYQVTCYAQGLTNGVVFYGVGPDVYTANQWALYTCQSTGQFCQFLGCR